MLAIRLDDELLSEVDALAAQQGRKRSAIVREALIRYLEDMEDVLLAEKALKESGKCLTLQEMRTQLGLDD